MLLLCVLTLKKSIGQLTSLDSLVNKIFFNIGTTDCDKSVSDFIQKYLPDSQTSNNTVSLLICDSAALYNQNYSEHNFIFRKHPLLDIKFEEGKLEFISPEKNVKLAKIIRARINFSFHSKREGDSAKNILINNFSQVCWKFSAAVIDSDKQYYNVK